MRATRIAGRTCWRLLTRAWVADRFDYDDHLAPDGRVMEVLSEHQCQGWLEGYLLTGRHGFFSRYEAFIHIVDSMFNQHAKWLKVTRHIPWRRPIASLNGLLSSHVWRQDHNGFSYQDPGFIDDVINKKAEVVRVYLPPDANCLDPFFPGLDRFVKGDARALRRSPGRDLLLRPWCSPSRNRRRREWPVGNASR
jgi:phosphoketolase